MKIFCTTDCFNRQRFYNEELTLVATSSHEDNSGRIFSTDREMYSISPIHVHYEILCLCAEELKLGVDTFSKLRHCFLVASEQYRRFQNDKVWL
jgi:hypothetical protein